MLFKSKRKNLFQLLMEFKQKHYWHIYPEISIIKATTKTNSMRHMKPISLYLCHLQVEPTNLRLFTKGTLKCLNVDKKKE